ncbi:MAG: methylenetetrahydrofolate reductase [Candidatus Micrarchaeia archaeon]
MNFREKLKSGKFVFTAEIDPPTDTRYEKTLESVRILKEAGYDAVNVADNPMARVRMCAIALSHIVQRETGIEAVLHFTCRDRSLLGMQSALLGAGALGIRNILAIKGDEPKLGDTPNSTPVYDIDTIGLIGMIRRFNSGETLSGKKITPTDFFVGTSLNINAGDVEKEIERFERKIEAGAEFAMTQPVYDVEHLREFLGVLKPKVPLVVGVLPIPDYRMAKYLNEKVPGIKIPQEIIEEIKKDEHAGVDIARELLGEIKKLANGAYVMPLNRYELACEIIRG